MIPSRWYQNGYHFDAFNGLNKPPHRLPLEPTGALVLPNWFRDPKEIAASLVEWIALPKDISQARVRYTEHGVHCARLSEAES